MFTKIKNYLITFIVGLGVGILMFLKLSKSSKIDSELDSLSSQGDSLKEDIDSLKDELDGLKVDDLTDEQVRDYWRKEL